MNVETKCTLEDAVSFFGRRHMLRLIALFIKNDHPCRYSIIKKELKINSKTLSDRLSDLTDAGLIERISYDEIPPRVEYKLSEVGEKLRPLIEELNNFEIKYVKKIKTEL
ncbi:MAG: helix-turn-helix transcriptional regulator [Candidatus Heimdallarchaeota archaeon]|nr:helix-turn-helix transcriptional regulator [Candidatus Heimdallarchaeota archaeon]